MKKLLTALATAGLMSGAAQAATNGQIMMLAVKALESSGGEASQQFDSRTAWVNAMRKQFGTAGPITVTSKVVHRYRQQGCGRVQTFFKIHDAVVVKGKFDDVVFSVNYNTCLDGQPPTETLDVRDVAKWSNPTENFTEKKSGLPPTVPLDQPNAKPRDSQSTK